MVQYIVSWKEYDFRENVGLHKQPKSTKNGNGVGENIKSLKISLKDTDCFSRSHVIDVSSGICRTKVFGKRRRCNLEAQCGKDVMSD